MDAAELDRRREVWSALSDLFLDTEVRWYLPRTALMLVRSGYGVEELQRIWRYEIVPECSWNLLSIAGEWAMMPLDETRLIARATRPPRIRDRLFWRIPLRWLGDLWNALMELRRRLALRPEDVRPSFANAWDAFAHVYLDERLEHMIFLADRVGWLRGTGLSPAECESTWERDFRPVYLRLLTEKEMTTEARRAENVAAFIRMAFPTTAETARPDGETGGGRE